MDGTQPTKGPMGGAPGLPRPPWWWLHALVTVAALGLLWAFSVPGFIFLLTGAAIIVLLLAAMTWVAWVFKIGLRQRRWSWWFVVAPTLGVIVLALLGTGTPLRSRWAMSRDAFDAAIASLPPATTTSSDRIPITVPAKIGSYRITSAYRVPGGIALYEDNGMMFDDAGFAYLPEGPSPSLENTSFESPTFRHLGGPWYSWTASW